MNTIQAFQAGGDVALSAPESYAQPLVIGLAEGVRVGRSGAGKTLLYREGWTYGMTLGAALELGWCWNVDDARDSRHWNYEDELDEE